MAIGDIIRAKGEAGAKAVVEKQRKAVEKKVEEKEKAGKYVATKTRQRRKSSGKTKRREVKYEPTPQDVAKAGDKELQSILGGGDTAQEVIDRKTQRDQILAQASYDKRVAELQKTARTQEEFDKREREIREQEQLRVRERARGYVAVATGQDTSSVEALKQREPIKEAVARDTYKITRKELEKEISDKDVIGGYSTPEGGAVIYKKGKEVPFVEAQEPFTPVKRTFAQKVGDVSQKRLSGVLQVLGVKESTANISSKFARETGDAFFRTGKEFGQSVLRKTQKGALFIPSRVVKDYSTISESKKEIIDIVSALRTPQSREKTDYELNVKERVRKTEEKVLGKGFTYDELVRDPETAEGIVLLSSVAVSPIAQSSLLLRGAYSGVGIYSTGKAVVSAVKDPTPENVGRSLFVSTVIGVPSVVSGVSVVKGLGAKATSFLRESTTRTTIQYKGLTQSVRRSATGKTQTQRLASELTVYTGKRSNIFGKSYGEVLQIRKIGRKATLTGQRTFKDKVVVFDSLSSKIVKATTYKRGFVSRVFRPQGKSRFIKTDLNKLFRQGKALTQKTPQGTVYVSTEGVEPTLFATSEFRRSLSTIGKAKVGKTKIVKTDITSYQDKVQAIAKTTTEKPEVGIFSGSLEGGSVGRFSGLFKKQFVLGQKNDPQVLTASFNLRQNINKAFLKKFVAKDKLILEGQTATPQFAGRISPLTRTQTNVFLQSTQTTKVVTEQSRLLNFLRGVKSDVSSQARVFFESKGGQVGLTPRIGTNKLFNQFDKARTNIQKTGVPAQQTITKPSNAVFVKEVSEVPRTIVKSPNLELPVQVSKTVTQPLVYAPETELKEVPFVKNKNIQTLTEKYIVEDVSDVDSKIVDKNKLRLEQQSIVKSDYKVINQNEIGLDLRTKPLSRTKTKVATEVKTEVKQVTKPFTTSYSPTLTTTKSTFQQENLPFILSNPNTRRKRTSVSGYDVFVRRRGTFTKISRGVLTYKEALDLGAERVGTTARATFKLVKSQGVRGTISRKAIGGFSRYSSGFKQKGLTFIERKEKRIKSKGEKAEITYVGLATLRARKKRRGFKLL